MVVDTGCAPIGVDPSLQAPAPPPPHHHIHRPPPPITMYSTVAGDQLAVVAKVPELVKTWIVLPL